MKKTATVILLITAVILVGAAIVLFSIGPQAVMWRVMGVVAPPPDGLDTSATRRSDQGLFQVTYASAKSPISINQIHAWTVHLETVDGQIVEQAEITVTGGMPQHGHGLPTQPQMTETLGNGDFLVEGLKFNMSGWWEVTFHITANSQSDSITFNLVLK